MLSAIVTNADTAEIWFLIALILFVIAAIMGFTVRAWWSVLGMAGLAFIAAGLLWL